MGLLFEKCPGCGKPVYDDVDEAEHEGCLAHAGEYREPLTPDYGSGTFADPYRDEPENPGICEVIAQVEPDPPDPDDTSS